MDAFLAIIGSIILLGLLACLTIIPWAIGLAHMWNSIFG